MIVNDDSSNEGYAIHRQCGIKTECEQQRRTEKCLLAANERERGREIRQNMTKTLF